ncbi:glycosyltransferase [Limosilactobacillus reuteri]|uniref:glycosyltransferase n=1 Tax=Limosilactobacillus reuteri TaxID=1598 RepID=UPI001E4AEDF5|nr:glycosyltransferase [Limosilactobacillus reuteri]MCC4424760.1 glycosyltransferase [Limosilactobacillus reuteri]
MVRASIIVPIYNVQNLLKRSMNSILNQDYNDYEVIIINDGSTDDSLKIAKELVQHDNRFKVYTTVNQGLAAARNEGLKYVQGDITYFMDADDQLAPNFLSIMINYFDKHPEVEIIHFTYSAILHPMNSINNSKLIDSKTWENIKTLHELMDTKLQPTAWSYISRSNLIKDNNLSFSKGRLFEDENFNAKLIVCAKKVAILSFDQGPYYYLIENRPGKLMTDILYHHNIKQLQDRIFITDDEYKYLKKHSVLEKEYLKSWYLYKLIWIYNEYYDLHKVSPREFETIKKNIIEIYNENDSLLSNRQKLQYLKVINPVIYYSLNQLKKIVNIFRKKSSKI